jgi:hypothetical protein
MENEFMKRGYLLPEGCKDLTHVVNLDQKQVPKILPPSLPFKTLIFESAIISWKQSASLPPLTRQVFIAPDTTVKKLAALLGQKPFKIICDLVQLGTFATVDEVLDFKVVSMVAKMNGFAAIKAG